MAAGVVSQWELRRDFVRVFPDVYAPRGYPMGAVERAKAAVHWTKGAGVLVGHSALAMLGCRWVDERLPVEIALPSSRRPPAGIRTFRDRIARHECCEVEGFPVTTPVRTGFDIARRYDRELAIPLLDTLCAATGIDPEQVVDFAGGHFGSRGTARLRAALELVDARAESPQESRTRLLLIDSGLPKPATQIVIRNERGKFIARVDMGWEQWRVAVEYDGAQHWTDPLQYEKDIDRIAALECLGWKVIRVSGKHLSANPEVVVHRVRDALREHGFGKG
ncbi:DUF559 domain-containing protein [Nocardia sp. NPDC051030]|uniref:endonuclease domain-containing protein n=1 Tax=Nocardia sp. NPDC051030 TaxID=3155162 RepID=UPI003423BCC3